jgi:hypothetical protein
MKASTKPSITWRDFEQTWSEPTVGLCFCKIKGGHVAPIRTTESATLVVEAGSAQRPMSVVARGKREPEHASVEWSQLR